MTVLIHRWHDYVCIKSEKKTPKNLKLKHECSKVMEHKTNIQKSIKFHQVIIRIWNFLKSYTIYKLARKEILRHNSNKICRESVHYTLEKTDKRNERFK